MWYILPTLQAKELMASKTIQSIVGGAGQQQQQQEEGSDVGRSSNRVDGRYHQEHLGSRPAEKQPGSRPVGGQTTRQPGSRQAASPCQGTTGSRAVEPEEESDGETENKTDGEAQEQGLDEEDLHEHLVAGFEEVIVCISVRACACMLRELLHAKKCVFCASKISMYSCTPQQSAYARTFLKSQHLRNCASHADQRKHCAQRA